MKHAVWAGIATLGVCLAPPAALAYQAGAVANGGQVTGKVTFHGTAPAPKQIAITKDNAVCGTGAREVVEVAVQGDALQNAVVYVTKVDQGKEWGPVQTPVLDQKGCRYLPDVLIVPKDADLRVRNSDPVLHNIHTYEIIGKVRRSLFNVSQPDAGEITQPVKLKKGNSIKIECDAHDFMHAWAFAAENPYAAVTGADGSFSIGDLPAGTYEVKAWHPVLGEKTASVTVAPGAAASASFDFSN